MKLRVKNIGILKQAEIEIAGITVIAGKNNTGKSTFGKALFSLFAALYNFDKRVVDSKQKLLKSYFQSSFIDVRNEDPNTYASLLKVVQENINFNIIKNIFKKVPDAFLTQSNDFLEKASKLLTLDDTQLRNQVIASFLQGEFLGKVQNTYAKDHDSQIELVINGKGSLVSIKDEKVVTTENIRNLSSFPVYLDDFPLFPWISAEMSPSWIGRYVPIHTVEMLKEIQHKSYSKGQEDLISLAIQEILQKDYLSSVWNKLEEICHGTVKATLFGVSFVDKKDDNVSYPIQNISNGLRVLMQLQEFILNGSISEKGLLILDEPEIHLHPEWQIVFAEMIVLLQKAMNLHILVTSHSPYFISALDAYSKKYDILEKNRYYFVERDKNNVEVQNVTQNIALIYDSLARPYQTIADVFME